MLLQEIVKPLVEYRRARMGGDDSRETVRYTLITVYLNVNTRSLESFGICESIVPENIIACALYH